ACQEQGCISAVLSRHLLLAPPDHPIRARQSGTTVRRGPPRMGLKIPVSVVRFRPWAPIPGTQLFYVRAASLEIPSISVPSDALPMQSGTAARTCKSRRRLSSSGESLPYTRSSMLVSACPTHRRDDVVRQGGDPHAAAVGAAQVVR